MIQGKFQLLNCYLIKNIAKAQIYRCTMNYIFLSTYSSYYHLCTTLISSVFVCLIECCIVFVFCWFHIETKDQIEAVFWQRLHHCQSLCQKFFPRSKIRCCTCYFYTFPSSNRQKNYIGTKKIRQEQKQTTTDGKFTIWKIVKLTIDNWQWRWSHSSTTNSPPDFYLYQVF